MTDDEKLAALFRDAAGTPPPSGFDRGDVTAASRRITVRRRAALVTGAVVVAAVAGIGSAVVLPRDAGTTTSAAGAAAPQDAAAPRAAAPEPASGAAAQADSAERAPAPAAGGCANPQDPALRALLDRALPDVVGAPAAATADVCRPAGERHVSVEVTEGGAAGILSVSVLPPGTAPSLPPGDYRSAPTASGATVVVGSTAVGGGPAPYAGRLPGLVAELAPRL